MPNKRVHSTIVTVRGDDMTDGQERLFDQRAQEICNDVRKLKDMSQLAAEFKKLAEDLVNSNFILYCYIPVGASGRVGWTFADENTKQQKERKPVKMWLGVGLEGGMALMSYEKYSYSEYYGTYYLSEEGTESHPFGGLHVDAAWPLSTSFALGATASLTYCDGIGFAVGPLAKVTFKNNSALLASIGIRNIIDGVHPYLSVGWKFSSPWYISAFTTLNGGLWDFGVGVGYSILGGK